MNYSLSHLADATLLGQLKSLVARDRITTAELLAHIAEVDERRLYAAAGCSAMSVYCMQELRMSRQTALKRIRVARTASQFPTIYAAIADGRLHPTAVILLKPHLTPGNVDELVTAASHKKEDEIELLLAERFPRPDWMTFDVPLTSPEQNCDTEVSARTPEQPAIPTMVSAPVNRTTPLSPGWFGVQCTVDRETQALMDYARSLIGPHTPAAQLPHMMKKAFLVYVGELERKKFAAIGQRRRRPPRESLNPRHIAAEVKNSVWLRDQGRCTFVSETGHACDARSGLQFDHIEPVARGGKATIGNLRLRCHAHNQYEAERTFGAGFMKRKREAARDAATARGARRSATPEPQLSEAAAEVVPWLRGLGFRIAEANAAAVLCESMACEPLEKRVRVALSYFRQGRGVVSAHAMT